MSDITINYKGNAIATMDASGTKTLLTEGKYLEDDVEIVYVSPGGGGGVTIKDAIEGKVTGDVVLTITDPPSDDYVFFTGLFRDNKISSLTINGLTHVPGYIASQTNVGTNGSQSILTSVSFPDATKGGSNGRQFMNAKALVSASFPSLTTMYYNYTTLGEYFFGYCSNLTTVNIKKVDRICTFMFRDCVSLTFLELDSVSYFYSNAFNGASSLATLVIRSNAVPTLQNINAFANTPFASGKAGGTLYVPSSLISSYQSASNWSTILGYATNSIVAIEGSAYDT